MKRKPKILHIGGSHSVHVADLVKELDLRGYPQCVFSYNLGNLLPKNVPAYFFSYDKFYPNKALPKDEKTLKDYVYKILKKEKPDIIHGHFLVVSCVVLNIIKEMTSAPIYLTPWSSKAWTTDKILLNRIDSCISSSKYFLLDQKWVFNIFKQYYKNLKDDLFIPWRMPLYLSAHDQRSVKNIDMSVPKLLSARVMREANHQDLFIKSLPKLFSKHPKAKATLLIGQSAKQGQAYFIKMINLAKKLNVYNRCTFIDKSLSKEDFSNIIKSCNIVYSISDSDMGGSQTTYQSMYSGAITVVKKSLYGYAPLNPGENVLVTDLTAVEVEKTLVYAADNLSTLIPKFFCNSRVLSDLRVEKTMDTLTKLYDGEKVNCGAGEK